MAEGKKLKHKHRHPQVSEQVSKQGKVFVFNTGSQTWSVYDHGHVIRSGHGSSGKSYCPDLKRGCRTPHGSFRIYNKVGANFRSSTYPLPHGGAPMPYGMFFHKSYAIHGSNSVPRHAASHGCIRVPTGSAHWLNQHLPVGTKVVVR
jgi:lipoprotein-anchoring transpeptidase ErfK/SrfK